MGRWLKNDEIYDQLARRGVAIDSSCALYLSVVGDLWINLQGDKERLARIYFHPEFPVFPFPVITKIGGKLTKCPKGVYYNGKSWQKVPWVELPRSNPS